MTDMATYNRLAIQSSVMNMTKAPEDRNYFVLVDVPADTENQVIVEQFNPIDDTHATITVTLVDLAEQFDAFDDDVPAALIE